jgi:solute carrier family 25 citrate transporter 1
MVSRGHSLVDDARTTKRFRSLPHTLRTLYGEHGFLGFYRGCAGTTLKQASATAVRMGSYDILKSCEKSREIAQTWTNFVNR